MSITVNSSPNADASIHDALYHVVTSTNIAQPNFKYVFDVYVNSVQIARVKLFQDVTTSKGIFNAEKIIRNYITNYFLPTTSLTSFKYTSNNIRLSYEIKYGEEYGGTTYTNLTSATYTVWNYYNDAFTLPNAYLISSYSYKWLTNRTSFESIYDDPVFVSFLSDSDSKNLKLKVTVYDSSWTALTDVTGPYVLCNRFTILDLCPAAINAYMTSVIDTETDYGYGVQVYDGTTYSDEIRFVITCNARFTPVNIYFLNQLGGYDSFAFRLVNKRTDSFEHKSFQKLDWTYSSGSMVRYNSSNVINAGSVDYGIDKSVSLKLSSDYISIADNNWLRELIASPEVYMLKNNFFYPVVIKSTTWEEKIAVADKMVQFNLDIDLGKKFNSQYR